MILLRPSVTIEEPIDRDRILLSIERAGRTCYKSEDKITPGSAAKFVAMIIGRGHESVLEHEKITARIICDRGVSHEIVRHRIASYSQESTRYCDYTNGHVAFIIPPWCSIDPEEYGTLPNDEPDACLALAACDPPTYAWAMSMAHAERVYKQLRVLGWKPEEARAVLPNSLKTEIVATMNLREWRHFFRLRTAPAAHPQMREIANMLRQELQEKLPEIFNDV